MSFSRRTGGNKEFHYTKEDINRIEKEDTQPTRQFKKSLREWRERKGKVPIPKDEGNENIGKYQQKKSLKYFLICFFIIVLILISYNIINSEDKQNNNTSLKNQVLIPEFSTCEDKAKELLPDDFILFEIPKDSDEWKLESWNLTWKDGVEMNEAHSIQYIRGIKKGENVNIYYPYSSAKEFIPGYQKASYSKRIIQEDGTIAGFRSFAAEILLKPLEGDEGTETYGIGTYRTKHFEVAEAKITGCNWVK